MGRLRFMLRTLNMPYSSKYRRELKQLPCSARGVCLTEEFLEFIKNAGIEKLYLAGIDTDCCVMKTAYDCFDKEIPFEVLTDCCASTGGKSVHDAACMLMRRNQGKKVCDNF